MNALFEGDLSDEDMINYANTIKDKMLENDKVMEQVNNNTKEQSMMGGFADAINSAVIESLDVHHGLATQVLGEERIREGFADIVYELIAKGLKQVHGEAANNIYEPESMVAEPEQAYGKKK
jgi:type I restriction enzyme R subunit